MLGLKSNIVSKFDYIYMIIMVIYMAQMTGATGRMIGQISGDLLPFLIPIVSSAIFVKRHKIVFNDVRLFLLCGIFLLWSFAIIIKMSLFSIQELSYYFFLFYAIIIAYIHIKGFGKSFFQCYEEVIVLFCKIAFILWFFCNLFPGIASSIMHKFQETTFGNNFLYIFNWMDPNKAQTHRNAGLSWEPGRFAIMVALAICVNLSREGVKFKGNNNIIWLLLALASTMSTTGYMIAIVMYSLFLIKKWTIKNVIMFVIFLIPITYLFFTVDFLGEKLRERSNLEERLANIEKSIDYSNSIGEGDERKLSLDRFESNYIEATVNVLHDPLLGYGRDTGNSFYSKNISKAYSLSAGFIKIFGQYGILLGMIIFYLLYVSSVVLSEENEKGKRFAFFLCILLSSVSYVTFCVPVFMTFWLYGFLKKNKL